MKYKVKVLYRVWDVYEVEADSEQEAIEIAEERANGYSLNDFNNDGAESTVIDTCTEDEDSDEEDEEDPTLPDELANADADELRRWERDQVKCFVPWLLWNETPTEWYAYAQGCPFGWTDYAWNGKPKATRDLMAAIGNGTHSEAALYNRYAKLVARLTWQREAEELRRRWDEAFSMAKDDPEKYRVIVETNEDDPTAKGNEFGRYYMVDGSESESCIDHAGQWAVIRSDTVKTAYEVHRPNWHQLNGYDDEWTQIFCICEDPNNVTRWARLMIDAGRVMDIYADRY